MINLEQIKKDINIGVRVTGYFIVGYEEQHKIGEIIDEAIGNILLTGESTRDDFVDYWIAFSAKNAITIVEVSRTINYFYTAIVD